MPREEVHKTQEAREAYGLPFEWDLVASLLTSPEAQRPVRLRGRDTG